jgi:predicted dehydrogenase
MLAQEKLDVVCILTPPMLHRDHTLLAVTAGCHVLCQKPMAMTMAEVDEMIAAAAHHGVCLNINENYRYLAGFQDAASILRRGDIGIPFFIQIFESVFWEGPPWYSQLEKLWMFEMGVHYFDAVRVLANSEPQYLHAVTLAPPGYKHRGDSLYTVTIGFRNGTVARIDDAVCARGRAVRDRLMINGSDGSLYWDETDALEVYIASRDHWIRQEPRHKNREERFLSSFELAMRAFVEALRKGEKPPVSGEDYRETMRLMFDAYASSAAKEVIHY